MNSPTDTNQASEDELKTKASDSSSEASYTIIPDTVYIIKKIRGHTTIHITSKQEAKEAIQTLIRTEKLKLLAEVRERAIPNPTTPAGDNEFVPLDELAKLEAEL